MKRSDFTLFWALRPGQTDWENLIVSGVGRVLLTYQLARTSTDVLGRLVGLNKRVVIRIEQENTEHPVDVARTLSMISHIIPVDAVIVGCEPDSGLNLTYGAAQWIPNSVYGSLPRTLALIDAIQGLGLQAVSPALSHPPDAISEDGVPLPGRVSFREVVAPTWQHADGAAVHLYALGWSSVVDEVRFKFALKWAAENFHLPLWIDECGVLLNNDIDKMGAYTSMADIIMRSKANDRVRMFCPFISVGDPGNPPAWSARYVIKDRAAYELLGHWIAG